jgi:predicted anti-sigma-YlaC factor YlaD
MTPEHISCQEVVELVTDYLEDRLDPVDRARVEHHLGLCDPCVTYHEQARTTIRLTGELREEDLRPDMRDRLLDAFRGWQKNV